MKLFRMIPRYIRDSFKSVFRNFSLSLASISCITVTLIIVSIAIILTSNVNKFTETIKDDVTVVAFLDNSVTEDEIKNLTSEIKKINNVSSVKILTKVQKKEELAKSNEKFANVVSTWSDDTNPLHDELLIKVKDLEKIKKTATEVEKLEKISSLKYGEGLVEKLVSVFKAIQKGMIIAVFALVVVTAFLITNTIKITIFSRKKEIEIMRLVGASNITVKIPFIVEGFVLGIIGSIIPVIATVYGYSALFKYFDGNLFSPLIKLVKPNPFIYSISLALLGIGAIVGMIGSSSAVRKYLKI